MPSGARFNGVDFDDIFEPGAVVASSSLIRRGGGPLQYAARGSVPKYQNVGLRVGGSDVSNLWLPKGSAPPTPGFDGQTYAVKALALLQATGNTSAQVWLRLRPDGTWIAEGEQQNSANPGLRTLASGVWLPAGHTAADYTVQFTVATGSGTGAITNGAPIPSSLSTERSVSLRSEVGAQSGQIADATRPVNVILTRVGGGSTGASITLETEASAYFG